MIHTIDQPSDNDEQQTPDEGVTSWQANTMASHELARQRYPAGALYVVATPIGNLGDITLRALHVLSIADVVACEDTRNTGQLLHRYGLRKPLIAAHQHNELEIAEKIIERLQRGERVALVSDAGTPAISDPGARIVKAVHLANLQVVPIPGVSAGIAALSVAGLTETQFHFVGFLPTKAAQRERMLDGFKHAPFALVFYEAPHRIVDMISALQAHFEPSRDVIIARELTKLFEEIYRCPLEQASTWIANNANHEKGEYVVVLAGATETKEDDMAEADRVLTILMAECGLKQAATLAAQITGQKKNALYERALQLKHGNKSDV